MPYLNISGYKFTNLTDLEPLKEALLEVCEANNILGTILLNEEGINVGVSGDEAAVRIFINELTTRTPFQDMQFKESWSKGQSFNKMRVKLKGHIIPFDEPVTVCDHDATHLAPEKLKQWLDEGKKLLLIDTRNHFETLYGTFKNAVIFNDLIHFRTFPTHAKPYLETWRDIPVVTFCTGGIRCEKVAPWLKDAGCKEVYQLHGGILAYFEKCGRAHYEGECYVFDERISVNADLSPSGRSQCKVCNGPIHNDVDHYRPWAECQQCTVEA